VSECPTLVTERLVLRPFTLADASDVQCLADDPDVASTLGSLPHPYTLRDAEEWIAMHQEKFDKGEDCYFAITDRGLGFLIGEIDISISARHDRGGIGYWIGKKYWNRGYCTEAASAVLRYGFEVLRLNRISSTHFARNPASGRVMQKLGMKYEGTLRQEYKKAGKYEDMVWFGILREEYLRQQNMQGGR
jgi:ribosomal-protein-alanine N-acetyltransferase